MHGLIITSVTQDVAHGKSHEARRRDQVAFRRPQGGVRPDRPERKGQ